MVSITLPVELFAPAESSHYEGTLDMPVLKAGFDLYSLTEPITWEVDITNTGDAFLVAGTTEATGVCGCARCTEDAVVDFFGEIEGYFIIDGEEIDDEEYEDVDYQVLPEDKTIDLEPLIVGALLLDAPVIPLCNDDCRGLCPQCGHNLNDGPCDCAPEEPLPPEERPDNPFAALKDYKFEQ